MEDFSNPFRLAAGGQVDRAKPLEFYFNGKRMVGYSGDTIASALIANGVNVIARSFKYHRPRGFLGSGFEDPNAMVEVQDGYGFDPGVRAGQVRLAEGMRVQSISGWPSLGFDVGAIAGSVSKFIKAGFYYKTFMWPNWSMYEPIIRRVTGFGRVRADVTSRPRAYQYHTCDVLIIGGGVAGIAAADALIGSGLKVVIVDDQPRLGGSLLWTDSDVNGSPGAKWSAEREAKLRSSAEIEVLTNTVATGAYENNMFTLLQSFHMDGSVDSPGGIASERLWKLSVKNVVLATGSIERPLVFGGNDRPGVMLASAVSKYLCVYGVAPASELIVFTNNDDGYSAAFTALDQGLKVRAVIDVRSEPPGYLLTRLSSAGIRCITGAEVIKTTGRKRLDGVIVKSIDGDPTEHIACDGLAMSGGFTPLIHLAAHRGIKPVYRSKDATFICDKMPDSWTGIGSVNGPCDLTTALEQGYDVARAILLHEGIALPSTSFPDPSSKIPRVPIKPYWRASEGNTADMFVDFQNDVTVADIEISVREGYTSVEHLKRYTTLGMGTDQGRTSNINGVALLAGITEQDISKVGTTTFRPPYTAIRMGTIAANRQRGLFKPKRLMPAHDTHVAADADFEDFGWQRPDWYRSNGPNREAAVAVEMAAVRNRVGIFDGSPLGKIEVTGPDAAKFLDRFYVTNVETIKPGKVRYSVMLRENSVIFDDGVITCIDKNYFLVGPTSAHAGEVLEWFERWRQTEWPSMRVSISQVTSNWASFAIAGPNARDVLTKLEPDFDVSNAAFQHMAYREGHIASIPARVSRVSFTGELQYEINVPARYGQSFIECLLGVSQPLGGALVGMEAWLRLRLEKGYLHLGSDTNGRTTPNDIGMAGVISRKTADFIGKRSLELAYGKSQDREELVGLRCEKGVLSVGGRVLSVGEKRPPCRTDGYVTSACQSPSLNAYIGLALIERGHSRQGEKVRIFDNGEIFEAMICAPSFYDPENERLKQ